MNLQIARNRRVRILANHRFLRYIMMYSLLLVLTFVVGWGFGETYGKSRNVCDIIIDTGPHYGIPDYKRI